MLVGERMSHPVITIGPDVSVTEALRLLKNERIRRLPVVQKGKLVGIVSENDLLNASPSKATTLSVWEIPELLEKIKVRDVMSTRVHTVTVDTPLEEAARIMADQKVGGLPVLKDGKMVGIITDSGLLRIFLEMLGARELGVRINVLVKNQPGEIAKLGQAMYSLGGNIIALGTFAGEDPSTSELTLKVVGPSLKEVEDILKPLVIRIKDIRFC